MKKTNWVKIRNIYFATLITLICIALSCYFFSVGIIVGAMNMAQYEDVCDAMDARYLEETHECVIGSGDYCSRASKIKPVILCEPDPNNFKDHFSTFVLLGSTLEEVEIEQ